MTSGSSSKTVPFPRQVALLSAHLHYDLLLPSLHKRTEATSQKGGHPFPGRAHGNLAPIHPEDSTSSWNLSKGQPHPTKAPGEPEGTGSWFPWEHPNYPCDGTRRTVSSQPPPPTTGEPCSSSSRRFQGFVSLTSSLVPTARTAEPSGCARTCRRCVVCRPEARRPRRESGRGSCVTRCCELALLGRCSEPPS